MKANMKKAMVAVAVAAATTMSGSVMAASATDTTTPFSVANNLDLRIVIPAFLYFRVGTDTATIDRITFSPTAAVLGNSTNVTGLGGDAVAGTGANVAVRGNNGQVVIGTTVTGGGTGMGTGTATDGFINYNQITTTSSDAANFPAPVLANAAVPNVNVTLGGGVAGAGKVTVRAAIWTYGYANTTVPSAGTYNGTVTYTATMP
jgi:hypothetical protein